MLSKCGLIKMYFAYNDKKCKQMSLTCHWINNTSFCSRVFQGNRPHCSQQPNSQKPRENTQKTQKQTKSVRSS